MTKSGCLACTASTSSGSTAARSSSTRAVSSGARSLTASQPSARSAAASASARAGDVARLRSYDPRMSPPAAPRRVLALFAKAPLPGQVKTRLCPPLRAEEAAALYEAMLEDIVDQHRDARDCTRALWFWPED